MPVPYSSASMARSRRPTTVSESGSANSCETCSLESATGSFRGTALMDGKSRIGLAA